MQYDAMRLQRNGPDEESCLPCVVVPHIGRLLLSMLSTHKWRCLSLAHFLSILHPRQRHADVCNARDQRLWFGCMSNANSVICMSEKLPLNTNCLIGCPHP